MKHEYEATDRDRAVLNVDVQAVRRAQIHADQAIEHLRARQADLTATAAAIIAERGGPKPGDEVEFAGKPYRVKKASSSAVTAWGAVRVSFRCCNVRLDGTEGVRTRLLLAYVEMGEEGGES